MVRLVSLRKAEMHFGVPFPCCTEVVFALCSFEAATVQSAQNSPPGELLTSNADSDCVVAFLDT